MTEERIDNLQMQINSLKIENERLNGVTNILENKLNQLSQSFMAHRDRGDIHGRTKRME